MVETTILPPLMTSRFTVDGSDELETRLGELCEQASAGLQAIVPQPRLNAIALGGGYGRGEGGVLRTDTGDEPYNDIEFYLFLSGSRLLNEKRYGKAISQLGADLSDEWRLHVEFKIDSLARLRQAPISMFTYDLVSAHRLIFGSEEVFTGCEHHRDSTAIPLGEATRLLYNRCSGLLLVRELLASAKLTDEQSDFAGRNLAKASLALGDALLVAGRRYHWSARERADRLKALPDDNYSADVEAIRLHHQAALEFKLHPQRIRKSLQDFATEHRELSAHAKQLWLWLESRRLGRPFSTINDYAFSTVNKCPETFSGKNYLLTMRTFGPGAITKSLASRYPRERLFNSLPLLLWNGEVSREPAVQRHLQRQLQSDASDWAGLVQAYKRIWPAYG